jgi:2-polyprenyl-3-methyl-5-hydroxy-6-metoxy-1,4-benzoquinol methylase
MTAVVPVEGAKESDPAKMSEEELYRLNIFHRMDEETSSAQLHSLYGKVNEDQDRTIIGHVKGTRVLDVGAGYGTLSRRLMDAGFQVTAIEPNPQTREIAKRWYGIEELPHGIYETPFEDGSFDTVILRECVEHLDFPRALQEIRRIDRSRVLVFQTNLNPMISLARRRIGHEEFNPQKLDYYRKGLAAAGFTDQVVIFRDPLAFPLSGGYHARQLLPRLASLEDAVIRADHGLTRVMRLLGIAAVFCWRYLLVADTPSTP